MTNMPHASKYYGCGMMCRALALSPLIFSFVYFCVIWIQDAFIHPEQIRAGAYIWTGDVGLIERLRRAFDWAALDTANPMIWQQLQPAHRIRPLSDIVQVADIVARPVISYIYPHPSLSPSALLFAAAAPAILFLLVRLTTGSMFSGIVAAALWMSSFGFLSVVVPDIHSSAKRFTILLFLLAVLCAEMHRRKRGEVYFAAFVTLLFASFFFDEAALGSFALAIVYSRNLTARELTILWALPVLFVVTSGWGLPKLYHAIAVDGTPTFSPFSNQSKAGIFNHLADPSLYALTVHQLGRTIRSMFGTLPGPSIFDYVLVGVVVTASAVAVWRFQRWGSAGFLVVLLANGLYLTLLDLFPPGGRDWLASYGYYYHSSLGVMFVLWLATTIGSIRISSAPAAALIIACIGISAVNFSHFRDFNRLVAITHLYPYKPDDIYAAIRSRNRSDNVVSFVANCRASLDEFRAINENLALDGDPFRSVLKVFWLSQDDLSYLVLSHLATKSPPRPSTAVNDAECLAARDEAAR